MTRPLSYSLRTFQRAGPRRLRCLICGTMFYSNALARAAHERSQEHLKNFRNRTQPR